MTPQTMSIITLMFPPHKRGVAMSVWGAAAGIASLVGPIAGGLLVDGPGWTWIFFINIPIGVVGTIWRYGISRISPPNSTTSTGWAWFSPLSACS